MESYAAPYRGLVLAAVAVNFAVLVVFVFLSVLQFDQVRSTLESERLEVVANRASEPLALAAAIGLDFSTVRSLDAILEQARQADDAIIALHVLDPKGTIVASTAGSDLIVAELETLRRLNDSSATASYRESGDYRYLMTFTRNSGDMAGALLVEYSSAAAKTSVWAMAGRLASSALVFALSSSIFSIWAIGRALRQETKIDREYVTADNDSLRELWRGKGESLEDSSREGIVGTIRLAEHRYRAARNALP